jgi:glycine oxidase
LCFSAFISDGLAEHYCVFLRAPVATEARSRAILTSVPADVVIVGAGIIGCAIARELAVRGAAVTLIDDRPVAGGATRASAGMLAPYVEAHERGPLLDLAVRSLDLYDGWIAAVRSESGIDVEYRRIGTLEVALDADHASDLQRSTAAHPGVVFSWMNAEEARRAHPALGSIAGALMTAVHGYVAAPQLASALAVAAGRSGASLRHARVDSITRRGSEFDVQTSAGPVRAPAIVLAAGAWTNAIGGIRTPPLRPVRGQLLHLRWQGHPLSTIVWGPECYIVPWRDGTLLVGATVEEAGFDERTTAAGIRDLLDAACELLPEGWGATFLEARVGLRPATPDELPVIGIDAEEPGIVHASGHYRNGVLLAPITAALVADLVVQKKSDPALDLFRPDRFRTATP